MKNLLLLVFSSCSLFLSAQSMEGKITFTEEVKLDFTLPEGMEHMRDKMPSSQKSEKELLFTANNSLWRAATAVAKEEASTLEDTSEEGGPIVKVRRMGSESELFKNLESDEQVEKQDFMGKVFLINGTVKKYAWKLTENQKSIAGYNCQQAIFEDADQKVEAWFTAQIPVSSGPNHFGALPGMILELIIDDGQTKISATKVEIASLDQDAIKAPVKGKKISQEEFDVIVEAKTKEMREEMGGSNVRVRVRQ